MAYDKFITSKAMKPTKKNWKENMKTIQIRCKAFSGEKVKINKIQVDDAGVVRVWDSVAGHYTNSHSLTARSIGKISKCMAENNSLKPIGYVPPSLVIG